MLGGVVTRTICAALLLSIACAVNVAADTPARAVDNTWDYSVQVSATVQTTPAKITLRWPQDSNVIPASYTVYRRNPGSATWGAGSSLSGSATNYTDRQVMVGRAYEYRIVKVTNSYMGYGYITA